jgi:hypothetical protein
MSGYRCYLLGNDNRIQAAEDIDCEEDAMAIERALAMLEERPQYRAAELWCGNRRVYQPSGSAVVREASAAADLANCARETADFLRLAAIELRRLADRLPSVAADQRRIADQLEEQAASLSVYLPVRSPSRWPEPPVAG